MRQLKVTGFELELMEQLWKLGSASVREIQESLPERNRPAYTTAQTIIYRMEEEKIVQRVKKIGNAHIFEPLLTRSSVYRRLIDDLREFFGRSPEPVMSHQKLDTSVLERLPNKSIMVGVIDLSTHEVETAEAVAARIRRALPHIAPERVIVATDCGMKYLPRAVAYGKLKAMAEGAALVRASL